MNDSFAIGVDTGKDNHTYTLENTLCEVSEAFHAPTWLQSVPAAILIDEVGGFNSQSKQDGSCKRFGLASFNMLIPEALEVVNVTDYYQELQALSSKQLSSATGFNNLELYFDLENCIN
jgi:hypothetical protein